MAKIKHTRPSRKNLSFVSTIFLIALLIIGFVGGYTVAKVKYIAKIALISVMLSDKDTQLQDLKNRPTEIMMERNTMMEMKNGKIIPMTKQVVLNNGEQVMPSGVVIKPQGDKIILKNGQGMNMDGVMTTNWTPVSVEF